MFSKFFLTCLNLLLIYSLCNGQEYAKWDDKKIELNNGLVYRMIKLPDPSGKYVTSVYKPVKGVFEYFQDENPDFQFEVNNKKYSGLNDWRLLGIQKITDASGGNGVSVKLVSIDSLIELTINYLLYPDLPVVRKNLVVKNLSGKTVVLESVDIEKFFTAEYETTTYSWICHDYGRRRSIGPYDGNMQDALVIVHNSGKLQGMVIGNEAAGVVKHTAVFWQERSIISGLTHKDARYPFRKYIDPNESFETPQVFTMVYNDHKDPDEILNTAVPEFVNRHLGTRLSTLKQKPTFVYNTWEPFYKDINEKLILELAKSAAAAGMKEFVIDDGWSSNYGDWEVDKTKFPHGLKPVFEYIKSLGMKPGLWISVGSASTDSKVFKAHPEWFVLDENQQPVNLHWDDSTMRTACFGTPWHDYIKGIVMKFAIEYGLEYMKLDFTVVTSPYRFDRKLSGCYATNHQGHRDHNESLYTNYESVWKLFDELHKAKPDLFIDCTFETMGGLQLIDYAMVKHADGNWLSNFFGPPEDNVDLRIRNMSWWRSPAIPSTALVIGNPQMQDSGWETHLKSLAGSLPIMLGDPRKLSPVDLKKYQAYAFWLQDMATRYDIMSYRQDLFGFGEPLNGMWDGFQRINTDRKTGGIVGIFRQGSKENDRTVIVNYLDPEKMYTLKEAITGRTILRASGKQFAENGFKIKIPETYGGRLFEIGY